MSLSGSLAPGRPRRPITAYKFRGSAQFDLALDMVFNQRLYCADWARLNDPMEGRFVYAYSSYSGGDRKTEVAMIIREKKRLRVCSLSRTFESHLLWAHYASGFDGLAVEVELPGASPQVKAVIYDRDIHEIEIGEQFDPLIEAENILTRKYKAWRYEKEVRIIQQEEYFELPKQVSRIIAGHRMKPALFKALEVICTDQHIKLERTRIENTGITTY